MPFIDPASGKLVQPPKPNAIKLETFVFDALPLCEKSIIYETDRADEFAPIKNAEGMDSPATSKAIQIDRAARWLEAAGVSVARGSDGKAAAVLEVSQTTAIYPEDLAHVKLPRRIEAGTKSLI